MHAGEPVGHQLSPPRDQLRNSGAGRPPADLLQPPGVGRRAAAVPAGIRRRGELRLSQADGREEAVFNQNLTYDAATGDNIPFSNIAARAFPYWGFVNGEYMQGWSNYRAVETSLTKRFSNRWQLSGQLHVRRPRGIRPAIRVRRCARTDESISCVTYPLRAATGRRRRVHASHHGPATPGGPRWHLGYGSRLPVERPLVLRIRSAPRRHLLLPGARHRDRRREPPARRRDLPRAERLRR